MSDWKNVQYKDGKYKTGDSGGGGSSTFAGLEDVSLTNLQNGQVPKYNSTTQKWENADDSGGGGSGGGGVTFEVVTDNGSYDNGTTITLTLTKKYSSPYPFPVNCLPLTNWNNGARVVVKTNTISYSEQSNQLQFEVYVSSTESYTCDWMIVDMINHGGLPVHHYSEDEQVVGTWTDGKPVYEKTINISNPSTGENTYTHGISNFDKLIGYKGNAYRSNGDMFNVPSPHPQAEWLISYFDFNATSYTQYIGSNFKNTYAITEVNLILQYTKTTD